MRLGNSKGNNRGKKYMMRKDMKRINTPEGLARAEKLNQWFVEDHRALVDQLKRKEAWDDDVMHETYMKMVESVLYAGLEIKDYRCYFFRAYFTNCIQGRVHMNRYTELPFYYDAEEEEYNPRLEMDQQILEQDIFDYVYRRYKLREFEIFKMYMRLKPAVNYSELSAITNVKVHVIQSVVSKIKKDLCSNMAFVQRRRELVA